jgi:preprotein translocase SecE subunit
MAVAVKNTPDSSTRSALGALIPASILGAVFTLACAAVVFWGIPQIWWNGWDWFLGKLGDPATLGKRLSFVGVAGLCGVEIVTIVLLAMSGVALVGPTPPRGLRAGVFAVLVWLFVAGAITILVGRVLERWLGSAPAVGTAVTAAVGLGLLYWGWSLFSRPKAPEKLRAFEEQGWFSTNRLKPMQGQRVRRATMLGIIILVGAGIWTLYSHGTLNTVDANWTVRLPFSRTVVPHPDFPSDAGVALLAERDVPILPDVKFTLPLLLAAAGLWLSFRVVHLPVFADFLIATEAELNKVSWPTRRSVVQDTVVVLATVLMLTVFLFLVDLGWGTLLSWKPIGVIRQSETKTQTQQTQDKIPY